MKVIVKFKCREPWKNNNVSEVEFNGDYIEITHATENDKSFDISNTKLIPNTLIEELIIKNL